MRLLLILGMLTPFLAQAGPPEKPGHGDAEDRARALVEAIKKNDPALASPFFFQKEPFRKVKGIKNPDKYFDYLIAVYHQDIQTLRDAFDDPDNLEFVSFKLGGWKRWVERGKEANAMPYWAAYKNPLVVKDKGRERTVNVRVMITWEGQWYTTHLVRKKRNETPDKKYLPRP